MQLSRYLVDRDYKLLSQERTTYQLHIEYKRDLNQTHLIESILHCSRKLHQMIEYKEKIQSDLYQYKIDK